MNDNFDVTNHSETPKHSESLSAQQRRLWVLEQVGQTAASHHAVVCLRVRGRLEPARLEEANRLVHTRHDVLRSRFVMEKDEPRAVRSAVTCGALTLVDLTSLPEKEREQSAYSLVAKELNHPFDLQTGPLTRGTLYRLSSDEHLYILIAHKIICDQESARLLGEEVAAAYASIVAGTPLPPPRAQYTDYLRSQEGYLDGDALAVDLSYWKHKLDSAPNGLELPSDRPRAMSPSLRGAEQRMLVTGDLLNAIKAFSNKEGSSEFLTLSAAFFCLLARYTGADDMVIGTEVAGRSDPSLSAVVGALSDHLVLRAQYSAEVSFRETLSRISTVWTEAAAHQALPFGTLLDALGVRREVSRNPLFQVSFSRGVASEPADAGGLRWEPVRVATGTESLDLSVEVVESDDELEVRFSYSTDLFDRATIERAMGHFRTLIQSAVENPEQPVSRLQMLTTTERHQLVFEWNDTRVPYPAVECVHQLVEEQVERTPDAVAVTFEGRSLTYRELNVRANRLSHYLAAKGVRVGSLVAVYMERSIDMLVAVLATLKTGAGYIPLDPVYPPDRLAFMLSDASPAALLTQHAKADKLSGSATNLVCVDSSWKEISQHSEENPESGATHDDLVYVIYTSGSTGKPKGVCLSHRALTNLILWQLDNSQLSHGSRTIQFTSLSFDVSFQEIFSTWCSGGTLVLISESLRRDPITLLRFLCQGNIGRLFLPFVALQHLAEATQQQADLPDRLQEVVTAGEQLRITRQVRNFFQRIPHCKLYNHYGPSESHVVTSFLLNGSADTWPDLPPIGKPIANTQIYILDALLNPVPVGVGGELYIGGVSLAQGYLKRPELTAEKFIPDPFAQGPEARLYKTGDLARLRPDGNIEYLGRSDHQVKIRGFRIELGEIENALDQHPAVRQSAVIVREDDSGQKWLVAYLVSNHENLDIQDLRKYLAKSLPEYMVPARFSIVPTLPLTPSGKVDRKALPIPLLEHKDRSDMVAPRNELEAVLVAIFRKVLNLDSVSVLENFFDLGGHSLLAGRLLSKISELTGRQIPLAALFRAATVESLAQLIEHESEVEGDPVVMEIQHGERGRLPFFAIVPPGEESLGYAMLARHMGPEQKVYKIQGHAPVTRGKRPYSEEEMQSLTDEYVAAMKSVQPRGPYCLGGLCDGTHIAEQIVLRLEAQGDEVGLFAIFDTWVLQHSQNRWLWKLSYYGQRLREMKKLSFSGRLASYKRVAENKVQNLVGSKPARTDWQQAYWPEGFTPAKFRAPVVLFKRPKQPFYYIHDPELGWGKRTTTGVEIHEVDFSHLEILREPHVRVFGEDLAECVARVSAAQVTTEEHPPSLVTASSEQPGS
jgi:amino acid adenylation domain-containing protein